MFVPPMYALCFSSFFRWTYTRLSWSSWACDTTFTKEYEFQKGQLFYNKESLLEVVRLYHICRNAEYKIKTSNQTVIILKCKKGCTWKLRVKKNSYSSAWYIVTYKGKHRACVLSSENVSTRLIHLTSSIIDNVIRNCFTQDPSTKVFMVWQMVKDQFGVDVTYMQTWYDKQKALLSMYGTYETLIFSFHASKQCNIVTWGLWLSDLSRKTMMLVCIFVLTIEPFNMYFGPLNLALRALRIANLLSLLWHTLIW